MTRCAAINKTDGKRCKKDVTKDDDCKYCANHKKILEQEVQEQEVQEVQEQPQKQEVQEQQQKQEVQEQGMEIDVENVQRPYDINVINILTNIIEKLDNMQLEKKTRQVKKSNIDTCAKRILYHEAKKDHKFVDMVRNKYNLHGINVPWTLIKINSDIFWETLDDSIKDDYRKLVK